jgi:hypothetical protein
MSALPINLTPQPNVLQIYKPLDVIGYFCFFSPIIVASGITSMSFWYQNFKGFIYLGFLLACCVLREVGYYLAKAIPNVRTGEPICNAINYSYYGNPTFSAFVFAFTIMYISLPMFSYGDANLWIFVPLIVYFIVDIGIKLKNKCIPKMTDLVLNILLGAGLSAAMVSLMYAGGSGKYLFFNELSSNKDVCYQPSEQSFKCSLYKDGMLVGNL